MPDWQPSTPRQKAILADLIARYEQHDREGTLSRGPRGIFYDLRPSGMGNGVAYRKPDSLHPVKEFGPMEAHPASVQEVLALARRAGIIREEWVADQRAPDPEVPAFDLGADEVAEDIAAQVTNAQKWFRLDHQRHQPVFIEVLCEPADLVGRLARIAADYGVPVYSGAGFDGLKGKRAFADRSRERHVPTIVLHVGDRDKHGEDMYVAAAEDAIAWLGCGDLWPLDDLAEIDEQWAGPALVFVRLALTEEQAEWLDLLDLDGKAEADSIPVPVMDRLLTDAIETLQDPPCREQLEDEEGEERKRLPHAIRHAIRHALGETSAEL